MKLRKLRKASYKLGMLMFFCSFILVLRTMSEGLDEYSERQRRRFSSECSHIFISSDKKQLVGMMALIHSIVRNTDQQVHFHLLTDSASYMYARQWIEGSILRDITYDLRVFPAELIEKFLFNKEHKRPVLATCPLNFARYFLAMLYPEIQGKVLVLDVDIIVLGDISELCNFDLEDKVVAFARNVKKRIYKSFDFDSQLTRLLPIRPTDFSINAGVMVTDLRLWRKQHITGRLLQWVHLNTKSPFYGFGNYSGASQPPLFLAFYNNYKHIPANWHIMHPDVVNCISYSLITYFGLYTRRCQQRYGLQENMQKKYQPDIIRNVHMEIDTLLEDLDTIIRRARMYHCFLEEEFEPTTAVKMLQVLFPQHSAHFISIFPQTSVF